MEEKKEEKKEAKKDTNKKPAKKKEPKAKVIPFDKIDITTASDDDIIKSGIKHNTKADMTCYFIMFIIVVLAILPVALRIIIPRPVTTEKTEIVYYTITCYRSTLRENYELSSKLEAKYRDGKVNTINVEFKWFKRNDKAKDDYSFTEVEELTKLKKNGISVKSESGKAVVEMNFKKYPELRQDVDLKDYVYHSTTEVSILENEKGYNCTTESKTEVEVIDIETREKIK